MSIRKGLTMFSFSLPAPPGKKRGQPNLAIPLIVTEATARNRTADILITSEVLCHLSYGGLILKDTNIVIFFPRVHRFLEYEGTFFPVPEN